MDVNGGTALYKFPSSYSYSCSCSILFYTFLWEILCTILRRRADDNKTPIERMMHNVQSWYYLNFRKGTSRNQASEPLASTVWIRDSVLWRRSRSFFYFYREREREKKENVVQDSLLVTMMKTNERDTLDGINAKFSPTFPSSNLTDIINRNNTIITCHLD